MTEPIASPPTQRRVLPALGVLAAHAPNIGWSVAEYFAYPLIMFASTPLFLSRLGPQQYGLWMMLMTFTSFGGVAGLGMGTATIKEVSAHRGVADRSAAIAAVRASLGVTLASSVALALLFIAVFWVMGAAWFGKVGDVHALRVVAIFAAALITLEQIDTVFAGAIRGIERFDVAARIEIIAKLSIVGAAALVAAASRQLAPMLAAVTVVTLLRALTKATFAARLLGSGPLLPSLAAPYVGRAIAFGKWTWLQSMGSALFATVDRLLVGSLLGGAALAHYSICLQLAQQVQAVPAAGGAFIFPLVSRRRAQGGNNRRIALFAVGAFALIGAVLAAGLIALGPFILRHWIGVEFAAAYSPILAGLAIAFAMLAANIGPHFFLLGENRGGFVAFSNIAASVGAAGIGVWAVERFGLLGAIGVRTTYAAILLVSIPYLLMILPKREHRT